MNGLSMLKKITSTTASLLIATALISSCATKPDKIEAAYVSPLGYNGYTCDQLSQEAARVSQNAAKAVGAQDKKAKNDAATVGIGLILFWPALLFVKGSGTTEAEVARLKGEMETIKQVSIQKQCGFEFQQS